VESIETSSLFLYHPSAGFTGLYNESGKLLYHLDSWAATLHTIEETFTQMHIGSLDFYFRRGSGIRVARGLPAETTRTGRGEKERPIHMR
jgi:hypothetical protein